MSPGLLSIDLAVLTKAADADAKFRLLGALVNLFAAAHAVCTPDDADALGSLMTELIFDLSPDTRAAFANKLAACSTAPRALMVKLANDRIAVARPVLSDSQSLEADDLVEIAQTQSAEHLFALASRATIPAPVSEAILRRAPRAALLAVVHNTGAEFSQPCLLALAKLADRDAELKEALDSRFKPPQSTDPQADDRSEDAEVAHLPQHAAVRESDLLAAARARKSSEAIRCFVALSGETEARIAVLFQTGNVESIAALCTQLHFSGLTFEATAELCLHLSEASPHRIQAAIKRCRAAWR